MDSLSKLKKKLRDSERLLSKVRIAFFQYSIFKVVLICFLNRKLYLQMLKLKLKGG